MTPDCPRPRTHAIARWPPPPAVFDFLRTSCFQICGCLARLLSCTHAIAHWPLTATVLDSLGVSCFSTPGRPKNQRRAPTCSNATPQAFPLPLSFTRTVLETAAAHDRPRQGPARDSPDLTHTARARDETRLFYSETVGIFQINRTRSTASRGTAAPDRAGARPMARPREPANLSRPGAPAADYLRRDKNCGVSRPPGVVPRFAPIRGARARGKRTRSMNTAAPVARHTRVSGAPQPGPARTAAAGVRPVRLAPLWLHSA